MNTVEEKRAIFHRYLEQSGVIEALSRALIKLYDERNKPDDPVEFVRQHMVGRGSVEGVTRDSISLEVGADDNIPPEESMTIESSILPIDEQTEPPPDNLINEDVEPSNDLEQVESNELHVADQLLEGFRMMKSNADCNSMLTELVNEELLLACRDAGTSQAYSLYECIRPGMEIIDHPIGLMATDGSTYSVLESVFDIVMEALHGSTPAPSDWGVVADIFGDLDQAIVQSITFGCRRGIADQPFVGMSAEQLTEISNKAREITEGRGTFTDLADIDEDCLAVLSATGSEFINNNNYLAAAGAYQYWPVGRAIFITEDKSMVVRINHEDHLQFTSKQANGNFVLAYQTLCEYVELFATQFSYAKTERWGWLTVCPSNAGAALEASSMLHLPKLSQKAEQIAEILQKHEVLWEKKDEDVVCLTSKRNVGGTESDAAKGFYDCIVELINCETTSSASD